MGGAGFRGTADPWALWPVCIFSSLDWISPLRRLQALRKVVRPRIVPPHPVTNRLRLHSMSGLPIIPCLSLLDSRRLLQFLQELADFPLCEAQPFRPVNGKAGPGSRTQGDKTSQAGVGNAVETVAKSALRGLGRVLQGTVIAEQGLVFVVNQTEKPIVGILPKRGAAKFVGANPDAVAGRGPVSRRQRIAIGKPFDPQVENEGGRMRTARIVDGDSPLRQHRYGSYGNLRPRLPRERGQEFGKTLRRW